MNDLADLKVLVSGGGSGIGRAFATAARAHGASVFVADAYQGDGVDAVCDVTDEQQCSELIAKAESALGGIDVLANSAGVAAFGPLSALDQVAYQRTYAVNVVGMTTLVRNALASLRRSASPSVVSVASAIGGRFYPGSAAYGTSKAALIHWTRVAANELAADGIRVNCICPGPIDTPMLRNGAPPGMGADEWLAKVGLDTALGRVGQVEEVAEAMLFLVSPRSSFVTGAVLSVDGGESSHDGAHRK